MTNCTSYKSKNHNKMGKRIKRYHTKKKKLENKMLKYIAEQHDVNLETARPDQIEHFKKMLEYIEEHVNNADHITDHLFTTAHNYAEKTDPFKK